MTSQYNNKFPEWLLACQRLIAAVDKKLVWNCIQVNKNQQTALHWDSYNEGPSVIVGLGDYEGGALLLHYKDGPVPYSVKESFLHFDGRLPHSIRVSFLVPRQSPCDLFIVDRDAMRCKHVFTLYDTTLCVFHCKRDYLWFGLRMG